MQQHDFLEAQGCVLGLPRGRAPSYVLDLTPFVGTLGHSWGPKQMPIQHASFFPKWACCSVDFLLSPFLCPVNRVFAVKTSCVFFFLPFNNQAGSRPASPPPFGGRVSRRVSLKFTVSLVLRNCTCSQANNSCSGSAESFVGERARFRKEYKNMGVSSGDLGPGTLNPTPGSAQSHLYPSLVLYSLPPNHQVAEGNRKH